MRENTQSHKWEFPKEVKLTSGIYTACDKNLKGNVILKSATMILKLGL